MKTIFAILSISFIALLNMSGHCQEQEPPATQTDTASQPLLETTLESFNIWTNTAIRNQNAGNVAGAESAYRKALTLAEAAYRKGPTVRTVDAKAVALVQSNLAMLILPQGKVSEAKSLLTKALLNDPNNHRYTMNMTIAAASPWRSSDTSSTSYQQPVTSQPSGATTLPVSDTSTDVVLHGEALNSAFRFTSEDFIRAVEKGKQLAQRGKNIDEVYKPVAQMPRGVKGEKGKSHESAVYCTTLNAIDLTAAAFKATNNYESLQPLTLSLSNGGYANHVHFFVSLVSVPKVGTRVFDQNRLAGTDDVQVIKFVLTDDKGNILNPLNVDSAGGVQSGAINFFGVNRFNHVDTSQTNTNANAYAYDSNGDSGNAFGTGTRTTTRSWTEFVPWSESHPYFSATYNVDFPLFDASGQPLIKTDAKSITLHMITPNGEKQVTYDLQPPKI